MALAIFSCLMPDLPLPFELLVAFFYFLKEMQ